MLALPLAALLGLGLFAPGGGGPARSARRSVAPAGLPSRAAAEAPRGAVAEVPVPSHAATGHPEPATTPSPSASDAGPGRPAESTACPTEMALVDGWYCPEVEHVCKRWLDPPSPFARCATYSRPARCKRPKERLRYCIDRREHTPAGESLPKNHASLVIGQRVCQSLGKRLCTEREWNFACEGEEMRPYPYGWERRPLCNHDREDLYLDTRRQVLVDRRWASGSRPACVSSFGVFDLVGNLDEPVLKEPPGQTPFRTALKGGWWMPARNRCRPATTAHDDHFTGIQIGIRCCADAAVE